jgi:iron complex outermembrane receptor protein
MKPRNAIIVAVMGLCLSGVLSAQQTREEAVKGMRKVQPSEMDPAYTQPAPYARKLVDEALDKHPEVLLMAIHAQPPGHGNVIVASNFDRIGKKGDEDDMRCIHTGKPNLEVNGPHFEDELALKDAAGRTIGALGVVFNYKPGDDKERLIRLAGEIGREMQRQIPDASRLFGPA